MKKILKNGGWLQFLLENNSQIPLKSPLTDDVHPVPVRGEKKKEKGGKKLFFFPPKNILIFNHNCHLVFFRSPIDNEFKQMCAQKESESDS